jgi:hypothetical protein
MNNTMQELLREATRLTQAGQLLEATAAIHQALGASVSALPAYLPTQINAAGMVNRAWPARTGNAASASDATVREACEFEAAEAATLEAAGETIVTDAFINGTHAHASLTRHYKLYVPPHHADKNLPLVAMLHGCTQDPDDFAAGTRMSQFARAQGFCVLYPAQAQDANRDGGHRGGFVPGNICGRRNSFRTGEWCRQQPVRSFGRDEKRFAWHCRKSASRAVRTIVFHGAQDSTVHARNGEQAFAAAQGSASGMTRVDDGTPPRDATPARFTAVRLARYRLNTG